MKPSLLRGAGTAKGDALAVARIAGIQAAKRTPDLVPLCHPVAIHGVTVDLEVTDDGVRIVATVRAMKYHGGADLKTITQENLAALDKGLATIRRNYENSMKKGKLKPEQVEQRMGLVTRDPSVTDLRAKEVRLTESGRGLVERIMRGHPQQIGLLMAGLDAAEQKQFHRLLDRLGTHLQAMADGESRAELV